MACPVRKFFIVTVFTASAAFAVSAQSYTLSPGDSIIGTTVFDDVTVFNIQQNNITSGTLDISYEKIGASIPTGWSALICDNSTCYPDLHQSGNMAPVPPAGYGLLSLHITPHVNSGTAIIQYAVWETSNPALKDTLTWLITSNPTGINETAINPLTIFIFGNALHIQKNNQDITSVRIMDINGKISKQLSIAGNEMEVDIFDLAKGIYFVQTICNRALFTKKVFVQ